MRAKQTVQPEWSITMTKEEIQVVMKSLSNANYYHEDCIKDKQLDGHARTAHENNIKENKKMLEEFSKVIK